MPNLVTIRHYYLAPGGGCEVLFSPGLSVCLSVCVCVCVCVRPIFWYFISRLLKEISFSNLYRTLPVSEIAIVSMVSMLFHGISVELYGIQVECHGIPWSAMEFHETPWTLCYFHGISVEFYGIQVECHGIPWNAMDIMLFPWNCSVILWHPGGMPWNSMGYRRLVL